MELLVWPGRGFLMRGTSFRCSCSPEVLAHSTHSSYPSLPWMISRNFMVASTCSWCTFPNLDLQHGSIPYTHILGSSTWSPSSLSGLIYPKWISTASVWVGMDHYTPRIIFDSSWHPYEYFLTLPSSPSFLWLVQHLFQHCCIIPAWCSYPERVLLDFILQWLALYFPQE